MAIDTTYGFNAGQLKDRIENYIGKCSDEFYQYVEDSINLAQFRFCDLHDWEFLHQTGLTLSLVNGQDEYDLSVAAVGYNIPATDVKSIYDATNNRLLRKAELQTIRRFDPNENDGNDDADPTHWAPAGYQRIAIYPADFESVDVKLDAKVQPRPVTNFDPTADPAADPTARLTVPYRYQESFFEFVLAQVLDRENDDRATPKLQSARLMVREDIKADGRRNGDTTDPRIRHWREADLDGHHRRLGPWYWDCDDLDWW